MILWFARTCASSACTAVPLRKVEVCTCIPAIIRPHKKRLRKKLRSPAGKSTCYQQPIHHRCGTLRSVLPQHSTQASHTCMHAPNCNRSSTCMCVRRARLYVRAHMQACASACAVFVELNFRACVCMHAWMHATCGLTKKNPRRVRAHTEHFEQQTLSV